MVAKKGKTVETIDPNAKTANIAPATEFEASGAPHQTVPDVDPSHPAVDANPREKTTELQNRIDFNDPKISGSDSVAKALRSTAEANEEK